MKKAIAIGVLLFGSAALSASAQEITIKSLAFTSLPYYSTTVYQVRPATSNTYCNSTGNGNINANVYSMPGGATVYGTTTTNTTSNCTTTYQPAQNQQLTWRTIYNYNLVEGGGYRYELLCTANWRFSKCAYLIPGQSFRATIAGSDIVIEGMNGNGKTKQVKYHILAMAPSDQTESPKEASGPVSRNTSEWQTGLLSGCLSGSAAFGSYTLTNLAGNSYKLTGNLEAIRTLVGSVVRVTGAFAVATRTFNVTSATKVQDQCGH